MSPWLILIPAAFPILRLITRKYVFSPLTTLTCALLAAPKAPLIACALVVSAVGDWFMSHKEGSTRRYVLGIAGFFLGHALFIAHALSRARFRGWHFAVGALLLAAFLPYLARRIVPKLPREMKLPVALYALISVAGFTCALAAGSALYAVGIGLLLFSDTCIAEADFAGNRSVALLILPTYYLCHLLVALSALV